jgi:hypothetical protein
MNQTLTILVPIFTLFVGSYLTWVITKRSKTQEWRAEVNKQLIQRRLDAYEHIMEATKGIAVAGGSIENGEFLKYHLIVVDSDYYDLWSMKFMAASSRFSHLIDTELSYELTKLNNYLAYLSNYLGHWNSENNTKIEDRKLKFLGQIIYKDLTKLTSDILEASGHFYSKSIYNESYEPSTIHRKEFELPEDFKNLFLFSEKEMINALMDNQKVVIDE